MRTPPRILVVGSINIDHVVQADRMPDAGESMLGQAMTSVPGGKGANQAVAAARLGAAVTFVGRVGNDHWGEHVVQCMRDNGVNTEHLRVDDSQTTGTAVILVDSTGENRIIVMPGANHSVCQDDVDAVVQSGETFDAVLLQFEIPIEVTQHAIECYWLSRNTSVIVDAGPARPFPLASLRGAHIISPNETEAKTLTGIEVRTTDDAIRAATAIRAGSDAEMVVMKLGKRGALIHNEQGSEMINAFDVDAIDTTAAGDSFTAALAVRLALRTEDNATAVRYANAAGALATTTLGAQPSLPTKEAVERFLANSHGG